MFSFKKTEVCISMGHSLSSTKKSQTFKNIFFVGIGHRYLKILTIRFWITMLLK